MDIFDRITKKKFYEENNDSAMADGDWPGGIIYELFPM
jgi:hypothetical protein